MSARSGYSRPVCFATVALQLTLLAWFVAELVTGTGQAGLAERVVGVAQAIWPLVVVLSCRSARWAAQLGDLCPARPGL